MQIWLLKAITPNLILNLIHMTIKIFEITSTKSTKEICTSVNKPSQSPHAQTSY